MITVNSPIVGPPTGTIDEALAWASPAPKDVVDYAAELWRLCGLVRFNAALLFSQWAWETGDGSSPWWINRLNPAGIGITGDKLQNAASHTWRNGTDAARAHCVHMAAYVFGAGAPVWLELGQYKELDPRLNAVIAVSFGGTVKVLGDLGNGKWAADKNYSAGIAWKANRIFKGATMPTNIYPVVGLPGPGIELPVPLAHDIIAITQPNQRPGFKRKTPGYWVQHETANTSPGADAAMHARWLHGGAEGAQLSFHFAVDDGQIIQLIPINEVTWQAADGSGPGNMSGISCELCVNAGIDTVKARHNAEALCGGILKALGMGGDQVKRHWDFNSADPNRHHCPDEMLNSGYWPTFVANTTNIIGSCSTPTYAQRMPIPLPLKSKTIDGHPFVRGVSSLTLAKDTVPRQYADEASQPTGKAYKKGRKITPQYITIGADGALWVCEGGSKPGNRWRFDSFVEGN